jgi:hypothetical protein
MKPTRIVLAIALAVVAAPALSQADEDKGLSSGALAVLLIEAPPAAPNAMAAPPKSSVDTNKADGHHVLTSVEHSARRGLVTTLAHDVDRPFVAGGVPRPAAVSAGPVLPRATGAAPLPGKLAPALRR